MQIGQKVSVHGKDGIVISVADKIKVKFPDGKFGFHTPEEVVPVVDLTELKGAKYVEPEATRQDPMAQKTLKGPKCPNCGSRDKEADDDMDPHYIDCNECGIGTKLK